VAAVKRLFLDTSVLLAGLIDFGERARSAQQLFDAIAAGTIREPRTAWHCCLEFYAVSTRLPEEFRLSPADALTLVEQELLARFEVHDLPNRARKPLFRSAAEDRVAGGRIYDAHIAEIARTAGAEVVVTENRRDFVALLRHGLRVLTPDELLDEL
jgi:predicted nucleic acid-binding protein